MVISANNPTYKVGFDLGGTKIEIIVLSQSGKCLLRKRTPTPSQKNYQDLSKQYLAILSSIKQLLLDSEKELGISLKNEDSAIGIGIPGAISPSTGLVKNANTVCLIGQAFQQDLEDILNCNVRIANDADCFVLSEAIDGSGQGARSVFGVIIGTGCGGGLVINQQLVGGPNAICGEWGHNPLPWAEDNELLLPCYCGKQGCIETFLSGPGFTQHANKLAGEDKYDEMKSSVMEIVGQHFRPEFINRVDDVVVFHPLQREQIRAIAEIQLTHLRQRLVEREIGLEVSDEALELIAEAGFDPVYGARPLKRVIQQQLENGLAQDLLAGQFSSGDVIKVTVDNDTLKFTA